MSLREQPEPSVPFRSSFHYSSFFRSSFLCSSGGSRSPSWLRTATLLLAALLIFNVLAFGGTEPWSVAVFEVAISILSAGTLLLRSLEDTKPGDTKPEVQTPLHADSMCVALLLFGLLACIGGAFAPDRAAVYDRLLLYGGYFAAFIVTRICCTAKSNLRTMATCLVGFGGAFAFFALAQSFTSPKLIYWQVKPRWGGWIFGSYVNHNHYAGLMEMLVPLAMVGALNRSSGRNLRAISFLAAVVMVATIFVSQSRGGMIAFAVQLAILGVFFLKQRRSKTLSATLALGSVVLVLFIYWAGSEKISERWSEKLSDPLRTAVLHDGVAMFRERPLLGWGAGNFASVYPRFRSFYGEERIDQAHDDYLQLFLEAGFLGGACILAFMFLVLKRAWRSGRGGVDPQSIPFAASIGCCGILVHSFTDFNLQIPANAALFFVLCAMASSGDGSSPKKLGKVREKHTSL